MSKNSFKLNRIERIVNDIKDRKHNIFGENTEHILLEFYLQYVDERSPLTSAPNIVYNFQKLIEELSDIPKDISRSIQKDFDQNNQKLSYQSLEQINNYINLKEKKHDK